METWGYLRETAQQALRAGRDLDTGVTRTGLEEYLRVIFPSTRDWLHDATTGLVLPNGKKALSRPDYRSESMKLIVEMDGLPHYQSPANILRDRATTAFYTAHGYKVVRIPYFIQLSAGAVETMFGVRVDQPLFDETIPSMGPKGKNTPAFLCPLGIDRMAQEFQSFPIQYQVNLKALQEAAEPELTGWRYLVEAVERL